MLNLSCEMCDKPTKTLSADKKHVICSESCLSAYTNNKDLNDASQASIKEGLLTVKGSGYVKVIPDRMRITVVVIKEARTVPEVNTLLVTDADKLITLLREEGKEKVEKIHTSNFNIDAVYKKQTKEQIEREEERILTGYEGTFPITFEAKIEDAGPLIDLALKYEYASRVRDLRYFVSDSISKPAHTEALRLATLDAVDQAQVVLDTLKYTRSVILRINVEDASSRNSSSYESSEDSDSFHYKSKLKSTSASTKLFAPEKEISSNVTIELSYV